MIGAIKTVGAAQKLPPALHLIVLLKQEVQNLLLRYKQQGNTDMAVVATQDAVTRWARVWELKAEMNCYDIQIRRSAY
jgi:hypothetical protein